MGRVTSLLTALLAATAANAASLPVVARSGYAVKERHPVPLKWKAVRRAPADHVINLSIALKQSQFEELERHLYEVSDPFHERYGQHLSKEEVDDLVKPSDETSQLVHEWLANFGIEASRLSYSSSGDTLNVALPVAQVEQLLDTEYSIFEHVEEGGYVVRTPEFSLPVHLHKHINTIQPTNSFFHVKPKRTTLKAVETHDRMPPFMPQHHPGQRISEVCNLTFVTPLCLRTLYGTIDYTPQVPDKNLVGWNNFLNETAIRKDVEQFLTEFRPDADISIVENLVPHIIDGGSDIQMVFPGVDLEGNLDAETIIGITFPTSITMFNTGGMPPFIPDEVTPTDTNEPYLTWQQFALAEKTLPFVISTSYGDDEQTVPPSFAMTVCNNFAQFGARGVTVLFSSGDDGVGAEGDCVSNDGTNRAMFVPEFPASCPFVTAVGATHNFEPEVVANDTNGFVGGSGFSNYFARPSYQDREVTSYLESLNLTTRDATHDLFNQSGRAYPDVSAYGQRFVTIYNGSIVILDGTSCSAPTMSGVLTLVNDALIAARRPVLGFLNPWLYAVGHLGFTDVTGGASTGCGTSGFPATRGWDVASGWGTPNFPIIKDLALATKFRK